MALRIGRGAGGGNGDVTIWRHWLALVALSAVLAVLLAGAGLPAALLLGPMLAGIALAVSGRALDVPGRPYALAQGVLGCMMARAMPLSVTGEVMGHWPILVVGIAAVIAASAALGFGLARLRLLPGTTAVWGSSPGAASAMVLMAEAYGADPRLVAFMQYTRVILVTVIASAVAGGHGPERLQAVEWFGPIDGQALAATLALALLGPVVAARARIPAGAMLVPLVAGTLLVHAGVMTIELPPPLLALAYALLGWCIGLRFTPGLLRHALRALPAIVAAMLVLIALCEVQGGLGRGRMRDLVGDAGTWWDGNPQEYRHLKKIRSEMRRSGFRKAI
ncbi:hypothetical protein DES42_104115 [Zavarzinia compransoris]|nr:hypothetical protein DES42_104115 [Zavarzinia compransoris]